MPTAQLPAPPASPNIPSKTIGTNDWLAPTTIRTTPMTQDPSETVSDIHLVAGVIRVCLREPVDGRESINHINASAISATHSAHDGSGGGWPSGTRVSLFATLSPSCGLGIVIGE